MKMKNPAQSSVPLRVNKVIETIRVLVSKVIKMAEISKVRIINKAMINPSTFNLLNRIHPR